MGQRHLSSNTTPEYGERLEKRQRAYELRSAAAVTEAEKIVWSRLKHNRLRGAHFRRQTAINGFIVDFYCSAAKLVVEVDGQIHDNQQMYDSDRDAILAGHGLLVLRFTNDEVKTNLRQVMLKIALIVTERRR